MRNSDVFFRSFHKIPLAFYDNNAHVWKQRFAWSVKKLKNAYTAKILWSQSSITFIFCELPYLLHGYIFQHLFVWILLWFTITGTFAQHFARENCFSHTFSSQQQESIDIYITGRWRPNERWRNKLTKKNKLKKLDFFDAPPQTSFHLNEIRLIFSREYSIYVVSIFKFKRNEFIRDVELARGEK